jgi:formylmethanofuran dehydrogenase subunit E
MSSIEESIDEQILVECANCHELNSKRFTEYIENVALCFKCYELFIDWAERIMGLGDD